MNKRTRQFCKHQSNVQVFIFEEYFESFRNSFEYYYILGVVEPREENWSPMTDSYEYLDD